MPQTLKPQDRISRYRVIGPLAAGGMGEVYEARDQDLERSVALKVLPRELVQNEERVRRFVREAKSASSLSHPHIVTIYEIGQDQVRPEGSGEGAPPGEPPVHFISMELVTGQTLTDKIHDERTDLKTLLGYLAQAADGLAKAHAAGIVHRDLKPSNIMITGDGYAKVLDFGLAKLTEEEPPEAPEVAPEGASAAATFVAEPTSAGKVLGTVGYMAPEQVAGKPVDARADIFAFGCILHEAATRRRAFDDKTAVETMHRILHEQPAPIEELNPDAPAALQRLIRRALAKDPDQRLQSMKDLAIELREIVSDWRSLTPSGSSATGLHAPVAPGSGSGRGLRMFWAIAGVVLAVVVGAVVWRQFGGTGSPSVSTPQSSPLEMTSLLGRADLGTMAVSPDGRFLAYASGPEGEQTLDVLQIATGSTVRVLEPRAQLVDALTFSPDGDFLYFRENDPEYAGFRSLFEVPSLGGTPTRKAFDVDTKVSFAPDGRRAAFWRGVPPERKAVLVVVELDSGRQEIVYSVNYPDDFEAAPAWAPDGKRIALVVTNEATSVEAPDRILLVDPNTGEVDQLGEAMAWVSSLAWLPDGSALALTGHAQWAPAQAWLLTYPDGILRQVTQDLSEYAQIQGTADGGALAAVRWGGTSNLWVQTLAGGEGRPLTFHSGQATRIHEPVWGPDGEIIHKVVRDGNALLWSLRPDGSGLRQLTQPVGSVTWDEDAHVLAGTRSLLFERGDSSSVHVFRLDLDTGATTRLTRESPNWLQYRGVAPDGTFLVWRGRELHRVPGGGGPAIPFSEESYTQCRGFSPDGRYVLVARYDDTGPTAIRYHWVVPAGGGEPVARLRLPPGYRDDGWAPDGEAITFTGVVDGVQGVFRQPLDGGPLETITRIEEGQIREHRWSPDGSWVAFQIEKGPAGNIWTAPGEGGEARQLTRFPTGFVFEFGPSPDGKSLAFTYGTMDREVVLIRNFR